MDHRSTLGSHQMHDPRLEQGISGFHILSGKVVDHTNRSIHSGPSASVNTAEQGHSAFYGNMHAVPNHGLNAAAPSNFYTPCVFPQSSSTNFHSPLDNGSSDQLQSANNQFIDNIRLFGKRKNSEVPPGNQHTINEPGSSSSSSLHLSLNSGLPQQSFEPVLNLGDGTNFEQREDQERGNIQIQPAEGSLRSVRSRSGVIGVQPETAYVTHPNYVLQATPVGPLHPAASNEWMAHFGTPNQISTGACPNWNYNHPVTYVQGAFNLTNMGVHAFPDASAVANAPVLFNPAHVPNFHHLSHVQAMQLQSYGHHVQIQATPYQHPFNNLHQVDANSSLVLNPGLRFAHFPSNPEQVYRSGLIYHTAPNFSHGNLRILSPEDAAVMNISGFYGLANAIDQHQDMRLDIDEMSYEELLALEEQIGDVKTGLTEEFIIRNLKRSVRNSKFCQETEACIICQVEYEDNEIIGTLDCGHNYHGECIKQWLLMKNLCPICKKTAMSKNNCGG